MGETVISLAAPNARLPFGFSSIAPKSKPSILRLPSPRCAASRRSPSRRLPSSVLAASASASLCTATGAFPPDFLARWRHLLEISAAAETELAGLPHHLIFAIVASEDLRFFYHPGVDPLGIARAVVFFPNGGGGSTITQQLTRRVFLTSERTASRKVVEGVLSLLVEKRLSKLKILFSYLTTIYWGHGIYGLQSASLFYFGKHPSFLTVGESALLAGILPGPEFLSPYINPSRGKSSQIRVLRRMVSAGFLDMETALHVAKQPLATVLKNEDGES